MLNLLEAFYCLQLTSLHTARRIYKAGCRQAG
jgi:hypothetical protein